MIKENGDLGHQVRHLTFLIETGEQKNLDDDNAEDTDAIITNKLVTFRNVEEMQLRNQELLKAVRSLTEDLKSYEEEKASSTLEIEIQALTKSRQVMQADLKQMKALYESARAERDMLKNTPRNRSPTQNRVRDPSPSTDESMWRDKIKEETQRFDDFRAELENDRKVLREELKIERQISADHSNKINILEFKLSDAKSAISLLESAKTALNHEAEQLRLRVTTLSVQETEFTNRLTAADTELMQLKSKHEKVREEIIHAHALTELLRVRRFPLILAHQLI